MRKEIASMKQEWEDFKKNKLEILEVKNVVIENKTMTILNKLYQRYTGSI